MKTKPSTIRTTCAEHQAALEFYVDAELRGEKARQQFPVLARHVQRCARCQQAYRQLLAMSRAAPALAFTPRPLPFLDAMTKDAPWTTQVRGQVGGARLGVRFDLPASLLRQVFAAPTYAALRGVGESDRALLLADTVRLGATDAAIELWLVKPSHPRDGTLDVLVTADTPLPEPLRITIRWRGYRYSKTLKEGRAVIEKINIASLQTASSVRVDFEAGAHGATLEEYRGLG